jgi:AraC-like DNA-binding protein
MLLKSLYLLTSIFGFITVLLVSNQYKFKKHINVHIIILFAISSVRFITFGLSENPILGTIAEFTERVSLTFTWPLTYIYLYKIIYNKPQFEKTDFTVYIVPVSLTLIYILEPILSGIFHSVALYICMSSVFILNWYYFFKSSALIYSNFLKSKVTEKPRSVSNKDIKKLGYFIYITISLLFLRIIVVNLLFRSQLSTTINQYLLWVSCIIWIAFYIKMLITPEFIYGYELMNNKIDEINKNQIQNDNFWGTISNQRILIEKDKLIHSKIEKKIPYYILEIEKKAIESNIFLKQNFQIEDLSNEMKSPKSHIKFIFKYHAKISFTEYKRRIRVQKAIKLINDGYLKANTLESLASTIGFSSYSTFFKSFKKVHTISPQEFLKKTALF